MNRYNKLSIIGKGTFGSVWLVESKTSGNQYAVKELSVRTMSDSDRHLALNEVKILSTLKHKNIIRYKDALQQEMTFFIVMEFAEGDLKTQNIFLTKSNVIKLGDFGIARILDSTSDHARTTVGTPYYLSPEICQQQPYNQKSDMWALGCVMYEVSTLVPPFTADCFSSLVIKILHGKYPPISRIYGPLLHDLIDVLLRAKPQDRPSAKQLLYVPAMKPYVEKFAVIQKERTDSIASVSSVARKINPHVNASQLRPSSVSALERIPRSRESTEKSTVKPRPKSVASVNERHVTLNRRAESLERIAITRNIPFDSINKNSRPKSNNERISSLQKIKSKSLEAIAGLHEGSGSGAGSSIERREIPTGIESKQISESLAHRRSQSEAELSSNTSTSGLPAIETYRQKKANNNEKTPNGCKIISKKTVDTSEHNSRKSSNERHSQTNSKNNDIVCKGKTNKLPKCASQLRVPVSVHSEKFQSSKLSHDDFVCKDFVSQSEKETVAERVRESILQEHTRKRLISSSYKLNSIETDPPGNEKKLVNTKSTRRIQSESCQPSQNRSVFLKNNNRREFYLEKIKSRDKETRLGIKNAVFSCGDEARPTVSHRNHKPPDASNNIITTQLQDDALDQPKQSSSLDINLALEVLKEQPINQPKAMNGCHGELTSREQQQLPTGGSLSLGFDARARRRAAKESINQHMHHCLKTRKKTAIKCQGVQARTSDKENVYPTKSTSRFKTVAKRKSQPPRRQETMIDNSDVFKRCETYKVAQFRRLPLMSLPDVTEYPDIKSHDHTALDKVKSRHKSESSSLNSKLTFSKFKGIKGVHIERARRRAKKITSNVCTDVESVRSEFSYKPDGACAVPSTQSHMVDDNNTKTFSDEQDIDKMKYKFRGKTLHLNSTDAKSMFAKIEALRVFLEENLGTERFIEAYHYLNGSSLFSVNKDSFKSDSGLEMILGKENEDYLELLFQLIVSEANHFGTCV